ncbi:acyl-CoA reductase-like NAD-dependent aldehyde dehydrogenase [Streptomyces olivoverticillatus]|uniref:Acyl-CoA reductase-like NAD-dependent aldehyde dehydrogenase n=1 Tax=Streptomyces olivoverticillatus TaxID=66427 RepID=A0A7W7LQ19_9ACTN|nr:aldehyde dehydrogenase family protein [Streptomyces olivoverticillatus]MBB4893656.1 acyl-CoA reductase-like NAD-dependent aldehyde dehydrogenase [Streptomyces olivoverticillatus]
MTPDAHTAPDATATLLTDPRTGRSRAGFPVSGRGRVDAAVAAARAAQPAWAALTTGERSRRMLALAAAVEDDAEQYVRAEQAGTGKPAAEARGEIEQCIDLIRFYAGAVRADLAPGGGHRLPGRESWVRWEPLGVIAAVVPWNYPLLMAVWRFAPALAAGNTVLLKPAETTPDSALLVAEDARETLGPDVLTTLPGDRGTGRLLVGHEAVDGIAFTGSRTGGLDVAARAGLRRVSLELGGNCAALVLPDAPDHTCETLVRTATYNAGQSCAAPARVLTLRENYERTVAQLAAAMAARRAGTDFGPLNSLDQAKRFDGIIGASRARVRHVAEVAAADGEEDGYWRPGMILADLPEDDPAVREEVFGPVLTVQAVAGPEELVRAANGVPHALAASVWGRTTSEVLRLATALEAGEVWVNCHLEQTGELPHGGRKQSGTGTDLSVLALAEYQRPKTVTVNVEQ